MPMTASGLDNTTRLALAVTFGSFGGIVAFGCFWYLARVYRKRSLSQQHEADSRRISGNADHQREYRDVSQDLERRGAVTEGWAGAEHVASVSSGDSAEQSPSPAYRRDSSYGAAGLSMVDGVLFVRDGDSQSEADDPRFVAWAYGGSEEQSAAHGRDMCHGAVSPAIADGVFVIGDDPSDSDDPPESEIDDAEQRDRVVSGGLEDHLATPKRGLCRRAVGPAIVNGEFVLGDDDSESEAGTFGDGSSRSEQQFTPPEHDLIRTAVGFAAVESEFVVGDGRSGTDADNADDTDDTDDVDDAGPLDQSRAKEAVGPAEDALYSEGTVLDNRPSIKSMQTEFHSPPDPKVAEGHRSGELN